MILPLKCWVFVHKKTPPKKAVKMQRKVQTKWKRRLYQNISSFYIAKVCLSKCSAHLCWVGCCGRVCVDGGHVWVVPLHGLGGGRAEVDRGHHLRPHQRDLGDNPLQANQVVDVAWSQGSGRQVTVAKGALEPYMEFSWKINQKVSDNSQLASTR